MLDLTERPVEVAVSPVVEYADAAVGRLNARHVVDLAHVAEEVNQPVTDAEPNVAGPHVIPAARIRIHVATHSLDELGLHLATREAQELGDDFLT